MAHKHVHRILLQYIINTKTNADIAAETEQSASCLHNIFNVRKRSQKDSNLHIYVLQFCKKTHNVILMWRCACIKHYILNCKLLCYKEVTQASRGSLKGRIFMNYEKVLKVSMGKGKCCKNNRTSYDNNYNWTDNNNNWTAITKKYIIFIAFIILTVIL